MKRKLKRRYIKKINTYRYVSCRETSPEWRKYFLRTWTFYSSPNYAKQYSRMKSKCKKGEIQPIIYFDSAVRDWYSTMHIYSGDKNYHYLNIKKRYKIIHTHYIMPSIFSAEETKQSDMKLKVMLHEAKNQTQEYANT